MDPSHWTALVETWMRAHPLEIVLGIFAAPLLVTALIAPLRRRPGAAPPAVEAPPEPVPPAVEAPPEPVPPAVEAPPESVPPAVEEVPEPIAAEPEAVAEPAPVAAPVPEPEPLPEPEPIPEPEPEPIPEPPARLGDRLRLTRNAIFGRLGSLLSGRSVDAEVLDELEMLLMGADLGPRTADELLQAVRKDAAGADADGVRRVLREAMLERLARVEPPADAGLALQAKPHVILVLGVNGAGKTTTIGKLAARHVAAGHRVVLGAGDTYRAAAIEQLQIWGERVGCPVVAGAADGDPAAVAFDTVKTAVDGGADVAIIDTAGRLQTKKPLMEELGKLVRVIGKNQEGAPHETLLVLDANTGQNAISQARLFTEVAGVTGIVLTKLDGTAKGGVIVGLADEFGIPVKHVGVGESVEDLRDFRAEEFVDALFEE